MCLALGLLERDDSSDIVNAADCEKFLVKGSDRCAGPWMEFIRPEVRQWYDTARRRDPTPTRTLGMYDGLTVEQEYLERNGVADRVEVVGGDFIFDEVFVPGTLHRVSGHKPGA